MNRLAISLALLGSVALGCGADVFDVTANGQATVPGNPLQVDVLNNLGPLQGLTNIDIKQDEEFKNQDVSPDDVDSVKVKSFALKILSPSNQDFSFLKSVKFWAEIPGQRVLIAEKLDIDKLGLTAPNPVLQLDVKDAELKQFVTAPSMTISTEAVGHQPRQDTTLEATVTLEVDVNVF